MKQEIEFDLIKIGDKFKLKGNKFIFIVTNKTSNSVELFTKARSEKGIDCKNWYEKSWINKLFEMI